MTGDIPKIGCALCGELVPFSMAAMGPHYAIAHPAEYGDWTKNVGTWNAALEEVLGIVDSMEIEYENGRGEPVPALPWVQFRDAVKGLFR
jgi:hypothetical protein